MFNFIEKLFQILSKSLGREKYISVSRCSKQAVCKSENWEFSTKDRNHMLYTENKHSFIIENEYEYCSPDKEILTIIYFDTIKSLNHDKKLCDLDKSRIKKRVKLALDEMGGKYEIC